MLDMPCSGHGMWGNFPGPACILADIFKGGEKKVPPTTETLSLRVERSKVELTIKRGY